MGHLRKSTIIECIASTPDRDVTNETLDLDGADISPLLENRGYVNSDHRNDFAHLIGRVLSAKKIYKAEDCTTPSQLKFWSEKKKPFLWCKAELWDGHGHKESDAIASIYKFYQSKNEAAPIKVSVEGKTLERGENGHLKRTLIKGIALTVHPCNRETKTEVTQITKSLGIAENDLIKSETALVPDFVEVSDESPLEKVLKLAIVARQLLRKASEMSESQEVVTLKSPQLLKQLKSIIAAHKGSINKE
jgi:hypothetical protein